MKKPALHKQLSEILGAAISAGDVGVRDLTFSVQPARIVVKAFVLGLGLTRSDAEADAQSLFLKVFDQVKIMTIREPRFAEVGHSVFEPKSLQLYVSYDDGYDHFFVGTITHDRIEWDKNANIVLNWDARSRPLA